MCPSIFTKACRLLPAQIHDPLSQNLLGWVFLCIDRISKKDIMGNTQQSYLRPAQLVKPQSEMYDWLVTWPLMGISAGEGLFPLIPIWRWDNRVGQLCYMFSGSSQHILYPKECQEALLREKQKCILSRGLIRIQNPSEKIFRSVEKGVWAFPNQDKGAILSLAIPSSSSFES